MVHADTVQQFFSSHEAIVQLLANGEGIRGSRVQSRSSVSLTDIDELADQVRATGIGILILLHDLGRAEPCPRAVWLLMPSTRPALIARGDDITLLIDCKFWAPIGDGPLRIVAPKTYGGHFAVVDGELEYRAGRPSRTLEAGMRRAARRIAALARAGAEMPMEDEAAIAAAA